MIFKNKRKIEETNQDSIGKLVLFSENLIDNTIRKLYQIQDIQSTGLAEKEKDKNRNIIINTSVKELLEYSQNLRQIKRELPNPNQH